MTARIQLKNKNYLVVILKGLMPRRTDGGKQPVVK
jgi:hypothetical protein